MNSSGIWARVLSAIAVVIGLILVVWELQQTRTLARAQLLHASLTDSYQYFLTRMGEESSAVHVKACLTPELMTDTEVAINFADNETMWLEMRRFALLESIANFGGDIDQYFVTAMRVFLGRPLGWHKYQSTGHAWPIELKRAAETVIEQGLIIACTDELESYINVFRQTGLSSDAPDAKGQ